MVLVEQAFSPPAAEGERGLVPGRAALGDSVQTGAWQCLLEGLCELIVCGR